MIVLAYHSITSGAPANPWELTEAQFASHISLCADRLITPDRFVDRSSVDAAAEDPAVLLTFDDATLSDYTHGFARYMARGTIPGFLSFVPVDLVGHPGHLSWAMVKEMARHGVTLGSHGCSHADLTALDTAALMHELIRSKAMLEDHTGRPVRHLAFPFGRFSRRVWEAALAAGYSSLYTSRAGHHRGFERFLVSRLCVRNVMDRGFMRRYLADPDKRRGLRWRLAAPLGLYRPMMRWRYR